MSRHALGSSGLTGLLAVQTLVTEAARHAFVDLATSALFPHVSKPPFSGYLTPSNIV